MHAHTIEWGTARSALCLHAAHPAPGDTPCLVWLQLDGGAVRAFALPLHRCHAATLETLARQCARDGDGRLLQYALDGASANTTRQVSAQALYAAPVSPGADAASWAVCARWLAWCERPGAAVDSACAGNACAGELPAPPDVQGAPGAALLRWSQGLDGEVVRVLASLGGERVYASCRNYTRLVRATPTARRYRLQALERYPNQLAHVLISPHHAYDLHGGRSHAWRLHDAALQSAVDDGGPLLQALAQACAVDKSVFKTPALRTNWPTLALSRAQTLQVLHGMPPGVRPHDASALLQAQPLWQWMRQHELTDVATLRAIGSSFLNKGIASALARLQRWENAGHFSWTDWDDFVRQLYCWEDQHDRLHTGAHGSARGVLRAWVCQRGLWDLQKACQRWHAALEGLLAQRRHALLHLEQTVQAPVRQLRLPLPQGVWQADLLDSAEALREEGARMQHCVATYWSACVEDASRIYSLRACDGAGAQSAPAPGTAVDALRVTAQYQLCRSETGYRYVVVQVRGLRNRPPGATAMAGVALLCEALNGPEAAAMRETLGRAWQALQQRLRAVDGRHAAGTGNAEPLLDATTLAQLDALQSLLSDHLPTPDQRHRQPPEVGC